MPFENQHAFRLRDPATFISIRVLWQHFGIMALGGRLKSNPSGGTIIQTLRFDRKKWTYAEARTWAKEHGYKPILAEKATGA